MPTIDDVAPDRATYRPHEAARVTVQLTNPHGAPFAGRLRLALTTLDGPIAVQEQAVTLPPHGTATPTLTLTPPPAVRRGYGLDATLLDSAGAVVAEGSGALDVLERWSQAPRYGFLSDFAPADSSVPARCDSLARYHLNVVQFYDWMWRHYALLPPADDFADALGRHLSLATVRAAIAGVHARGGAALAYGAVYGAEPEYANAHPDLALFDAEGARISLADLFYIMSIAPGSPWIPHICAEFARAVRDLDFDGIHLDQYGFPVTARTADGRDIDLGDCFPPLINAARAAVVEARPDAGVIFNAVGNWPTERVAPTSEDAVYIEVWPPDVSYNDLHRLIREARGYGEGKAVILAAYLSPFAEATPATWPAVEAGARLATAAIAAAGGFHLLLGEQDGILCDPYYPKYAHLRPEFVPTMRAYYDFLVRYEEWLNDPALTDVAPGRAPPCRIAGLPVGAEAAPGTVWALARHRPGYRVVHLINLLDQGGVEWNAPRTPPQPRTDLTVTVDLPTPAHAAYWLTPDAALGRPQPLPVEGGATARVRIPALDTWGALVFVLPPGA